jgi:ferredoxin
VIYVNDTVCSGCGECIDICPTGALTFQNSRAFIDQERCQGCDVCLDVCPEGAILYGENLPAAQEVIRIPEVPAQVEPSEQLGLRDIALPAINSLLLWTGRELVPRLADMALGYLDQRIKRSQSATPQKLDLRGSGRASWPAGQDMSGRRRRRHRRNRRFANQDKKRNYRV